MNFTKHENNQFNSLNKGGVESDGYISYAGSNLRPEDISIRNNYTLEHRIEEMEEEMKNVIRTNNELRHYVSRLEAKQSEREVADSELFKRLSVLITTTSTLSEKLKILETVTFSTLHQEVTALRDSQTDQIKQIEEDIRGILLTFKEEMGPKTPNEITDYVSREVSRLVTSTFQDFMKTQKTVLHEMINKIEKEVEVRHRRLVESTHTAISDAATGYETAAPQIRTLQNEMLSIREQIRQHGLHIDAIKSDTSIEGPVIELKEWIQDIERKIISRNEVEESIFGINSTINTLKHSSNAEQALLNQKLEIERNTRESAINQINSRLISIKSTTNHQ